MIARFVQQTNLLRFADPVWTASKLKRSVVTAFHVFIFLGDIVRIISFTEAFEVKVRIRKLIQLT